MFEVFLLKIYFSGHQKCSPSEFSCESGQCIPSSLHCDGKRDCPDHSDEEGCPASSAQFQQCPMGQIQCQQSGKCVLAEWRCDHDLDCDDGTDEKVIDFSSEKCISGFNHSLCFLVEVTHTYCLK